MDALKGKNKGQEEFPVQDWKLKIRL